MHHNKKLLLALGLILSTPLFAKKKESQKEIEAGQTCLAREDYESALKHFERAVRVARDPFEKMQARLAVAHVGLEVVRDDAIDKGDENTITQVNIVEQKLFVAQTQLTHPTKRYQALQNGEEILQCISVATDPHSDDVTVSFIAGFDVTKEDINIFDLGQNFMIPAEMALVPYQENLEELEDAARFAKLIDRLNLPDEALTEAKRQLKRLEAVPAESPEKHVLTQYLDTFLALPWGKFTEDNLDMAHAKKVLDNDHYGLEEIKERILDFLAVRAHCKKPHATIICFVGPPGVGKTSLGKSIAKALGRNYQRVAVGGVHDESEIRGHRSTYVGAMPGKIMKAMKKAESMNPVMLIDEIDKVGKSNHRGDPASALLEVLDPEQNDSFVDHYIDVPFDLSQVLFITTSNDLSAMPEPLKDRMEIIELSGYTLDEKMEIAKRHLLPQARESCGLMPDEVQLSDEVLDQVIANHTREAGVRELRRVLTKLCAKYTRALVDKNALPSFAKDNLTKYLGPVHTNSGLDFHRNRVGMTNGLAWTSVGGVMIQVEAVLAPGKGKLHHTGKQGTMSLEAAKTALTWVKTHADEYGIAPEKFTENDLHIHSPACWNGDGPSAGVTSICTILSVFTDRPIDATYAMTGEVSLHGDVLAIGGLKEKLLAAKHEGVLNVFIPKSNVVDLEKIDTITEGMNIMPVENVREIIEKVLLPKAKNSFF